MSKFSEMDIDRQNAAAISKSDKRRIRAEGTLSTFSAHAESPIHAQVAVSIFLHPDGERAQLSVHRIGPDEIEPGYPNWHSGGEIWLPARDVIRVFDVLMEKAPYRPWYEEIAAHPLAPNPAPLLDE